MGKRGCDWFNVKGFFFACSCRDGEGKTDKRERVNETVGGSMARADQA